MRAVPGLPAREGTRLRLTDVRRGRSDPGLSGASTPARGVGVGEKETRFARRG